MLTNLFSLNTKINTTLPTIKELNNLKKKYNICNCYTKIDIVNTLINLRVFYMDKEEIELILPLIIDKNNKETAIKSINLKSKNITDFKNLWKPLPNLKKMSKEELIQDLKKFRDAWQQNNNITDEDIENKNRVALEYDYKEYCSKKYKNAAYHLI